MVLKVIILELIKTFLFAVGEFAISVNLDKYKFECTILSVNHLMGSFFFFLNTTFIFVFKF